MKKYAALFRQKIMTSLHFRAETAIWIIIDLIPLILMIFVWSAVFAGQDQIQDYSLNQVMQYYFIVAIIQRFTEVHFERKRAEDIRNGKIDYYLTRPFSYIFEIYTTSLAGKIMTFLLFIPAVTIAGLIILYFIPEFTLPTIAPVVGQFSFLFLASHLIQFLFGIWIVLLTFWLEGSSGLEHFKWVLISIFSGTIMPIAFMPEFLQQIINALPFKYLYAVPIAVLQNQYQLILGDYLYLAVTTAVMMIFTYFFWQKARRQYAAVGG